MSKLKQRWKNQINEIIINNDGADETEDNLGFFGEVYFIVALKNLEESWWGWKKMNEVDGGIYGGKKTNINNNSLTSLNDSLVGLNDSILKWNN